MGTVVFTSPRTLRVLGQQKLLFPFIFHGNVSLLNIHCLYLPRCNEFVLTCEVHRHTLNNPDQNCCDILFDTEPIFTGKGTCYRTNKTIYEYYPYSFSSIKIWTNLLQDQTPGTIRIIVKSNSNSN